MKFKLQEGVKLSLSFVLFGIAESSALVIGRVKEIESKTGLHQEGETLVCQTFVWNLWSADLLQMVVPRLFLDINCVKPNYNIWVSAAEISSCW